MKYLSTRWSPAFALVVSFLGTAYAEERIAPIVVTAARTEQSLTEVVADVTVIGRDVIERHAAGSVADVLAKEGGIQLMRQGGLAANTELYVRGADTRFTAVFIDGIRVESQSASGGVSWSSLPLSQIDRIEILRGPAGAIYGSDAVAGVIQIFTKKGEAGVHPSLMVGRGTFQTDAYEVGVHGGGESIDYSFGYANEKSNGYNLQKNVNPDEDGYTRDAMHGKVGFNINPDHRLELLVLGGNSDNQYDGGTSVSTKAKNWVARRTLNATGLVWHAKVGDSYKSTLSASQSKDLYETLANQVTQSLSETQIHNYLWNNEIRIGEHRFQAALERREDHLNNRDSAPLLKDRSQDGIALGYGLSHARHTLQLNVRHDHESQFGSKATHSAAYAYALGAGWRATTSVGTAFRAPTLYQQYHSVYGVADLKPQFAHNKEVGLKYEQGTDTLGVTVYQNRIENMIDFQSDPSACPAGYASGCYASTTEAMLKGVTLFGSTSLGRYNLRSSLDVQDPYDMQTGKQLRRRSKNIGRVAVDTTLFNWRAGVEAQFFDQRYDDASNTKPLAGYGLLNLYATTPVSRDMTFLLRVDNATNRAYVLAANYYPPGATVFAGLRWTPQ
jgi:vitamin B12 transporter